MTPALRPASFPVIIAALLVLAGLLAFLAWPAFAQSDPTAPSNLTAEIVDGGVSLSWDAPTENGDAITGYQVLRRDPKNDDVGVFTTIENDTGDTATSYIDTTATQAGKSYTYRVKAWRGGDLSDWSNYVRVDLPAEPEPTPTPIPEPESDAGDLAPSNLAAAIRDGGVALTWDAPAEDAGDVTGYSVLRAVGDGELAVLAADTDSTDTAYTDATTTGAGETYAYTVKAIRGAEQSQGSNRVEVQLPHDPADLAPSNLTAEVVDGGVSLAWNAPAEDSGSVTGYQIQRTSEIPGDSNFRANIFLTGDTATSYKDTSATTPGARYAYTVEAIRDAERSQASNRVEVEIPNPAADLAPSNVAAEVTDDGVSLTWDAPVEDAASVTAYEIQRTAEIPGEDNPPTHLTLTSNADTAYTDTSATQAGARYTYRVRAVRDSEQSQWSGPDSVQLPEPPPRFDYSHATTPSVLVKNTGQMLDTNTFGIHSTVPKIAQAFTTGSNPTGYTLSSIGINFDAIDVLSTAGSELTATVNATTTESGNTVPGNAWCTLEDPGSFTANVVNTFSTPTGGGACPTLTPETTYFLVLQRANVASGGIVLVATNRATEDSDKADGWSIGNSRHFVDTFENPGSWGSASTEVHMIEVNGFVINNPATGAPSITGILQQGETLTADIVGISDADGLTSATYTYQWIKVDSDDDETDISGATGSTYTLTSNEEDHGIKLRVGLTDAAGHSEEGLTSAQTENVVASGATRKLIWLATLSRGTGGSLSAQGYSTLDAGLVNDALRPDVFRHGSTDFTVNHLITNDNGDVRIGFDPLPTQTVRDAWILNGLRGTDVVPTELALKETTQTTVSGSTVRLWGAIYYTFPDGNDLTVALLEAVNAPATGAPSIQGILQKDQTLTADTVGIADPNGVPSDVTYTYQWIRADDATDDGSDISGETGNTYTLAAADVGKRIRLKVSFTDSEGFSESPVSAATGTVVAENAIRRLIWLGTMTVGERSRVISGITSVDHGFLLQDGIGGLSPASFEHSSITYTVTEFTYLAHATTVVFSVSPSLSGVDIGNWTLSPDAGATRGFFRYADGLSHQATGTEMFTEVLGHVAPRYAGWTVGTEHTVTLEDAFNVAATGVPTITGVAQAGETLTAEITHISDPNGKKAHSYEYRYQWLRVDSSDSETNIGGVTNNNTYTPVPADVGKTIKVKVNFTDQDGFPEGPFTSDATTVVLGSGNPGVNVDRSTLTVDEGLTATYNVVLNNQPTADVVINITPGGGLTVDQTSLTFTTTNWDTAQTVTVTAPEDTGNADDETAAITHAVDASSAAEYQGVMVDDLEVTAADQTVTVIAVSFLRTGPYGITDTIQMRIPFTGHVTVTGTPQLELDIGGGARQAVFDGGSGSQILFFEYLVAENDLDTDGVSIGANKLTLNGGAITKADGTPVGVLLSHPAMPDDANQMVDGVRPTPQSAATSANGSEITITFSEALVVHADVGARLTLKLNGVEVPNGITAATGSGSVLTLTLASPVTVGQTVTVSYQDPSTAGDFLLTDVAGNDAASFDDFAVTNNALHVVTITADTSPVTEGTDAAFTLTRNGSPSANLTVNVSVTEMGDFIMGNAPTTVTFTGAETTAILTVHTDDDAPDENDGSVTAVVTASTGATTYFVGPDNSDTVMVQDNDIVPEPPRHFTASSGHEKVRLIWDAPAERAVDKYRLRHRRTDSTTWIKDWTDVPGGADARLHTVEDLTNEVEYTFELRAVNSAGNGEIATDTAVPGRVVLREPARISEGETSKLTITPRDTPFDTDQTLTLVLAGDYASHVAPRPIAGQDFTVSLAASDTPLTPQMRNLADAGSYTGRQPHYTITLPANQESVAVKVMAIDDDEPETTEAMVVWVFRNGQAINREPGSADFLFIRASDPSPEPESKSMAGNTATVTFNRAIKRIDYEVDEHNDNPPAEETAFLLFTGQNPPTFEGPNKLPTPASGQTDGVYAESFSVSGNTLRVTFPQPLQSGAKRWLVYDKTSPDGPLGDGSGSPYGHDVGRFIIQVHGPGS